MKFLNEKLKSFFISMISTFLIIILFSGFVIVEKNTRYVAFGDTSPFFVYEHSGIKPVFLKIHFMGRDFKLNFI